MTEPIDRRALMAGAAVTAATVAAPLAAAPDEAAPDVIALWPGEPPGGRTRAITFVDLQRPGPVQPNRAWSGIERPRLLVRAAARPNGTAALIMPGGAYLRQSIDNEGEEQARWLNTLGVTCFILAYRLPAEGWTARATVPLMDAQRAMRLIRAGAGRHGIRADRVLALGFSAGGHLAGSLATRHGEATYAPVDAADAGSARPDLAALLYPVVTLAGPLAHGGSRDALLGEGADEARRAAASVQTHVDRATPPVFLAHAADDSTVPVGNSLLLYDALRAAGRPAELHLFEEGGHGFGVRLDRALPAAAWPDLLVRFARRKGVLPPV